MAGLNVFETIWSTTHRIEPFHSQFLADALDASRNGDRSLFDGFWQLAAPPDWPIPRKATVKTELAAGNGRRIDLCIQDEERCRILGIEVKTSCTSRSSGQLEAYEQGLVKNNPNFDIAIAYLTPFNRERAGAYGDKLETVQLFQAYAKASSRAGQHVSWLDVAELSWDGRAIWRDHQTYVRKRIAPNEKLRASVAQNRRFNTFFGEEAAGAFWEALAELRVLREEIGARIELDNFAASPRALARTFEILIEDGDGVSKRKRRDDFPHAQRQRFLQAPHADIHSELFGLAARFPNVWIEGRNDYSVRVAHTGHKSTGVSLVRSLGSGTLRTGEPR